MRIKSGPRTAHRAVKWSRNVEKLLHHITACNKLADTIYAGSILSWFVQKQVKISDQGWFHINFATIKDMPVATDETGYQNKKSVPIYW